MQLSTPIMAQIQRHVRSYLTTTGFTWDPQLALDNYIKLPLAENVFKREKSIKNIHFSQCAFCTPTHGTFLVSPARKRERGKKKVKE